MEPTRTESEPAAMEPAVTQPAVTQPWHENMEMLSRSSETPQTKLPGIIHKCQVKHRTQLVQEFFAAQGIRTLKQTEIIRRGWTRRMIKSELAGAHTWITGVSPLYRRETVAAAESRPEVAQAIKRNLEARALGGIHTRSLAGNPDSPQAVVFLTSIIDKIVGVATDYVDYHAISHWNTSA